jgi:hypothetical protein
VASLYPHIRYFVNQIFDAAGYAGQPLSGPIGLHPVPGDIAAAIDQAENPKKQSGRGKQQDQDAVAEGSAASRARSWRSRRSTCIQRVTLFGIVPSRASSGRVLVEADHVSSRVAEPRSDLGRIRADWLDDLASVGDDGANRCGHAIHHDVKQNAGS